MSIDYQVIFIDMKTREAVVENDDGSYTIFINAQLNYEQQLNSYCHAMKHIVGEDFYKENVQEIEALAHG